MSDHDELKPCPDSCEDPVRLWAEIHTLRAAIKGPDGFDTWKDAAVSERLRVQDTIDAALESLISLLGANPAGIEPAYYWAVGHIRSRIKSNPLSDLQAQLDQANARVVDLECEIDALSDTQEAVDAAFEHAISLLDRENEFTRKEVRDNLLMRLGSNPLAESQARMAELERTVELLNKTACNGVDYQLDAQQKISDLTAQLEAARKDAKRYRWLMSNGVVGKQAEIIQYLADHVEGKERIDAYIDEAMKEPDNGV